MNKKIKVSQTEATIMMILRGLNIDINHRCKLPSGDVPAYELVKYAIETTYMRGYEKGIEMNKLLKDE